MIRAEIKQKCGPVVMIGPHLISVLTYFFAHFFQRAAVHFLLEPDDSTVFSMK